MSNFMQERAKRGAEYLDKANPGWFLVVSIDRLNIKRPSSCAIGQVYGDYNAWYKTKSLKFVHSHGFYCTYPEDRNWKKLTSAWVNEVNIRKNGYLNKVA